jgi:hypothetical protein
VILVLSFPGTDEVMKIGLVRHFRVNHAFPESKFLSKTQVVEWFAQYDSATNLEYKKVELTPINWQRCYTSPMVRAISTARHIYNGEIIEVPELKELDILHQLPDRLRLPFFVWGLWVRIKSFSRNHDNNEFQRRIAAFLDKVLSNDESDVLIVSHWFVMRMIRKELIRRGLHGSNFRSNDYGTLYIYQQASPVQVDRSRK